MQKLIILVACLVLATYCQSSTTNNDPCVQFTSRDNCGTHTGTDVSCNWCETTSQIAGAGLCLTVCPTSSPTSDHTACAIASRASVICPDGSAASSVCKDGVWTAPVCSSSTGSDDGSCTGCSASFQAANPPQLCSDGVTVAGPVCNLKTCQYEYTSCPGCTACPINDDLTANTASFVCNDGSVGGPTCNYSTCQNYIRECPDVSSDDTAPACPDGSPPANCLVYPCFRASESCPSLKCVPNYCNCSAVYFNGDGIASTCTPSTTPTTSSCSAGDCTGDKPTATCSNAQFFCARQGSSNSGTSRTALDGSCAWTYFCPATISTTSSTSRSSCDGGCAGLAQPAIAIACHDGSTATPKCVPVQYPYASASSASTPNTTCTWSLSCPESSNSGNSVNCVSRGVCGELCVADGSSAAQAAVTPNTATCASSPTCQQSCFLANQVGSGCSYVANRGCQTTLSTDSYLSCLRACAGTTTSEPGDDNSHQTCSGRNICECNYAAGCFFCQQNITTSSFSVLVGRCLNTTSGDTCTATGASIFPSAPQQCSIFEDNDAAPVTTSEVANALSNLDPQQLQAQFAQQVKANSNSGSQNIAVVIKNILNANGTSPANALVQLLITVVGNSASSLTDAQQQYITSVLIPSLQKLDSNNAANLNTATYAQVSTSNSNVKRSIQQSNNNDYIVTVGSNASPPPSSATGYAVSFVTMVVAVIVLVLN